MFARSLTFVLAMMIANSAFADGGEWHRFAADSYVTGDCEDFNKAIREKGTMGHPKWAGATKLEVTHNIKYLLTQSSPSQFCGVANIVHFPFTTEIETRVTYWAPDAKQNPACQARQKDWQKTVNDHEEKHSSDIENYVSKKASEWKPKVLKQCASTKDEAEAMIRSQLAAFADAESASMVQEAERMGEVFHNTGAGAAIRPLECNVCR